MFLYIGHRGTRIDYDENTIPAFEAAIVAGVDFIELDVQKTRDEKLIVFHDNTLKRITNHTGTVNELNYMEIKSVKTKLTNEKIPLLSEVLNHFKNKTNFMIDLKDVGIRRDLIHLITGMKIVDQCVISGRDYNALSEIKDDFFKISVCYNITKGNFPLKAFMKQGKKENLSFNPDMISLRSMLVKKEFIEICVKNEIIPLAWDFLSYSNPIDKITALINNGIKGILFDNYKHISIIKKRRALKAG
ncbi:MAG: putative Glycerophosphoryl diester phosphodiesterase [Promethearchaeota archaeon]|nr:MAG: putative Glycerophosphoryl diester phosphodiesterase [Candidatus Lokiarchaeota archaeon]